MKKQRLTASIILSVMTGHTSAIANDSAHRMSDGLSLGLMGLYKSSTIIGYDADARILPYLSYRKGRLTLSPLLLQYTWLDNHAYKFNLGIKPSIGERDNDKAEILKDMDSRKNPTKISLSGSVKTPVGRVRASVNQAVNKYNGVNATLSVNHPLFINRKMRVVANAGVAYLDAKTVDYYYGVSADEATDSRQAYEGEQAFNPFIGYQLKYQLDTHWSITHGSKFTQLDDSIVNSSLTTDDKHSFSSQLGIMYKF